jgi:hypothetical protein
MTCIVSHKTKKAFKQAVADNPQTPIEDPSIFASYYGRIDTHPGLQDAGSSITVTNHPKRSWFAQVKRVGTELKVT